MATVVVKTIGNGTRDYTSIGAWEDACPSNLVTSDQIWKGELYPEGSGTNGQWDVTATPINVGGITSDADHYLWLTTAAGQSWYDNANKLTNAFKYNNANGVAIQIAGNYTCLVESTNTGLRFTGLQIRSAADLSGLNIARQPARFERCIIEWRKGSPAFRFGQTLINCLVWIRESGGSVCNGTTVESGNYRNTTFIGPGSGTAFTTLQYSSNNVIRNCAVFNFSSIIGNSAHWTGADCLNNATDLSAFGIGSSNQTSLTYSAQFTNTTSGSEDFRAVESGSLDGNGVRDQTFTDDLDAPGQTRSTTAPTIGAWEVVAAAAPDELFELNDAEQQAAVAQVLAAAGFPAALDARPGVPISNRADVLGTDAAISALLGADPSVDVQAVLGAIFAVAVEANATEAIGEDAASGTVESGVGSADATSTAQAVGAVVLAAQAASDGASTAQATGAARAAGVAATAGTATVTATGAAIAAGVASSAGTSTVDGVAPGSSVQSGVASSAGASTAQATGAAVAAGVAATAGTATAQATGRSTAASVAATAGTATAQATGASTAASVASAAGTSTAQAASNATGVASGVASSSATATAQATGASTAASTAATAGVSTAAATGAGIVSAIAATSSTSTAQATGRSTAAAQAQVAGTATAQASATAIAAAAGSTAGVSTALGVGLTLGTGLGTATAMGSTAVLGVGMAVVIVPGIRGGAVRTDERTRAGDEMSSRPVRVEQMTRSAGGSRSRGARTEGRRRT